MNLLTSALACNFVQSGQVGNEDELMDQETQLQLIEMGITSPVTKENTGVLEAPSVFAAPCAFHKRNLPA